MSTHRLITLLTDFGLKDAYVSVLKGVIAQINPPSAVIDITHEIPPQNIGAGRFCLMDAYPYFPPETVHIAVVDPGVGSIRRAIAIDCEKGFLVGPDNGLFSGVLSRDPARKAVELTNRSYWRTPAPSATFHGRDIFAAVGAHLATGVPLTEFGNEIPLESLTHFPLSVCIPIPEGFEGYIQYIDRFGNLVTNVPSSILITQSWSVRVGDYLIPSGCTYSDVEPNKLIALAGSHGWLEIACNGGSAQAILQLEIGKKLQILLT